MSMYRGQIPAGQPRTVRSNAQQKNGTKGFPDGIAYDAIHAIPVDLASPQQYRDVAQQAPLATPPNPSNPSPFDGVRRGG